MRFKRENKPNLWSSTHRREERRDKRRTKMMSSSKHHNHNALVPLVTSVWVCVRVRNRSLLSNNIPIIGDYYYLLLCTSDKMRAGLRLVLLAVLACTIFYGFSVLVGVFLVHRFIRNDYFCSLIFTKHLLAIITPLFPMLFFVSKCDHFCYD